MSATNVTTYYEFPVFIGSDKPAWLVDWNGAMNAIDSAIHEAKAEADANATNIASLQSSVTSLSGSVESQGSSITSLTQSLTSLQGTVNTITSLIGNGLPTTDDKTIIGAINELKADIDALDPSGQGVQAENVSYDNTDSGLTADDVQSAIDELKSEIDDIQPSSNVVYSTTERKIGVDADGSDVYEKTYYSDSVSLTSSTVLDATLTSTYVGRVISIDTALLDSTEDGWLSYMDAYTQGNRYVAYCAVRANGLNLVVGNSTVTKYHVTVRYTKA